MDSYEPELRANRLKPFWRALMISNLALGAYLFAAEKKKAKDTKRKASEVATTTPVVKEQVQQPVSENQQPTAEVRQPNPGQPAHAELQHPKPEDNQHDLFNWMLEEENKRKPKDYEEQKRIDEEKAILEQFIQLKSTPRT